MARRETTGSRPTSRTSGRLAWEAAFHLPPAATPVTTASTCTPRWSRRTGQRRRPWRDRRLAVTIDCSTTPPTTAPTTPPTAPPTTAPTAPPTTAPTAPPTVPTLDPAIGAPVDAALDARPSAPPSTPPDGAAHGASHDRAHGASHDRAHGASHDRAHGAAHDRAHGGSFGVRRTNQRPVPSAARWIPRSSSPR